MNERLLQFIWQLQYYNRQELKTGDGETLYIVHPGIINTNQGPDFLNAKIKVNNTFWAGSIELHVLTSDWNSHHHSLDKNYGNIILHVVWENDINLQESFPVLELQSLVSKILLQRFNELMNSKSFIACETMIPTITPMLWVSWKERLLVERMQRKTSLIFDFLACNHNHWEETFWWLVARNFGNTVNSDSFEKLARSLSINILAKHKNQIHQTEALLFGQAGLLNKDFEEDYPTLLKKEYLFLKKKYQLLSTQLPLYFLRMRPSNFPSLRLAQLSMLIHKSVHLFSIIKETILLEDVKKLLSVTANDYWHYHYVFEELSDYREKNIGQQMIHSLLINTIVPIIFAYGHQRGETKYKDRALLWLGQIAEENNSITNGFKILGIENKNAFDSQALIQLKNDYCNQKRCLECAVGNKLLRPLSPSVY